MIVLSCSKAARDLLASKGCDMGRSIGVVGRVRRECHNPRRPAAPYHLDPVFRTPAVPEPSTWVMMILGFLGLGLMAYRNAKMREKRSQASLEETAPSQGQGAANLWVRFTPKRDCPGASRGSDTQPAAG
jgi:hypothetical protein